MQDDLPDVPPADAKAMSALCEAGALASRLGDTHCIAVDFRAVADRTGDEPLERVRPLAPQIVRLNLAGTRITDAGLVNLSSLRHLQSLHLEKTSIGDEGLAHLKDLTKLRYLNLYESKVSDKGLDCLKGLKNLRNLYLWRTRATGSGAEKLARAIPGLDINLGCDAPPR